MNLRENEVGGGILHGMGQLRGRLFLIHFLKTELRFDLAGGRIKAAFLFDHGFLGDFRLRLIRLGLRFFHPLDGLFQLRLGKIGVGKLQTRFSFHADATSCGLVVMTRYSSVSFGKWSMKGRIVLP